MHSVRVFAVVLGLSALIAIGRPPAETVLAPTVTPWVCHLCVEDTAASG